MSKKKGHSKLSRIFWRIAISTVGVALIVIAVAELLLFFFGEATAANVSTRRVGGADDDRPVSQRYEWSVDYTFKDKNNVSHNGIPPGVAVIFPQKRIAGYITSHLHRLSMH